MLAAARHDDQIVVLVFVQCVPPQFASEEGVHGLLQFPVKLGLVKHCEKNFLGENMLDDHLPHVKVRDMRIDHIFAENQELLFCIFESSIAFGFRINLFSENKKGVRQIFPEKINGFPELPNIGRFAERVKG